MSKAWYCAICKHQQELRAAKELRNQKYAVYLPKLYRHPTDDDFGRGPHGLRFPGYIFVAFDYELGEHGPINNTRGLDSWDGSALLTNAKDIPLPLRQGFIEKMRALEDEDFEHAVSRAKPEPRTDLRDGDMVIINDPAHVAFGQRGLFMTNEHGIARVLLGRMSWEVEDFHLKKVEKAGKKAA